MTELFKCASTTNDITVIYFCSMSDFVINDGIIVRKKRKYGKFKRPVYKFENSKPL